MRSLSRLSLTLLLAAPALACPGGSGDETGTSPTNPSTGSTTDPGPTTDPGTTGPGTTTTEDPSTAGPTTVEPTTVEPSTAGPTTVEPTTVDPTTAGPTTEDPTGEDPFVFDETPPDDLVQLDRMGMPAVSALVISAASKDDYNEASPVDDAMMAFTDDIFANIIGLHDALDDDLDALMYTPCSPGTCAMVAGPYIVPDVLTLDTTMPPGFPNGRGLAEPAIDLLLALVFLDLDVHAADTFAALPLNPAANDKEFLGEFPYLADPH